MGTVVCPLVTVLCFVALLWQTASLPTATQQQKQCSIAMLHSYSTAGSAMSLNACWAYPRGAPGLRPIGSVLGVKFSVTIQNRDTCMQS